MKKLLYNLKKQLILICIMFPALLYSQQDYIGNPVLPNHPRLLLLANEEQTLLQQLGTDESIDKVHNTIINSSNELLNLPPVENVKGELGSLLSVARECLRRVFYLSYAWRITGDIRYSERAEQEMLAVAAFEDWNHLHSLLDASEITMGMAIGYDWLYNNLSPASRETIREAIYTKGLQTSAGHWFLTSTNNWNQVCNASMLYGAFAIYEDYPAYAKDIINRSLNSIQLSMGVYQPDGAYPEGYGYWSYGTSFNVMMLSALEKLFGHDFGLSSAPGFMNTGSYYLHMAGPSGIPFNYYDVGSGRAPVEPTVFWFAEKTGDKSLLYEEYRKINTRLGEIKFLPALMIWNKGNSLSDVSAPPQNMWVGAGATPVAVMRTSWTDPNAIYVGVKGGSPNTNHAHMDIGSFVMEANGVRWAADLGMQKYDIARSYGINLNNAQRWTIFRNNNYSHSTLTVNGNLQNASGVANITSYSASSGNMNATVNLNDIYKADLQNAERTVSVIDESYVVIKDKLKAKSSASATVRWQMLTQASPTVEGDKMVLKRNGRKLDMTVNGASVTWQTWSTAPPNVWDVTNNGTVLVGFEITIPANGEIEYEVLLTPEDSLSIEETIVFKDEFTGSNTSTGIKTEAVPAVTYTSNLPANTEANAGGSARILSSTLRIRPGQSPATPVANIGYVMGTATAFSEPYKTRLEENEGTVRWYGGMMYERTGLLSNTFQAGSFGSVLVLACDKEDPTDPEAKGYGAFLMSSGAYNSVHLMYFTKGINGIDRRSGQPGSAGRTIIARGGNIEPGAKYVMVRVIYEPTTGNWEIGTRIGSDDFENPFEGNYSTGMGVNDEGTAIDMPYFGYASCYSTSSARSRFDNFYVTLSGVVPPVELTWVYEEDFTISNPAVIVTSESDAKGVAYTSNLPTGGDISAGYVNLNSNDLRIGSPNAGSGQTATGNLGYVMGQASKFAAPYAATLNQNASIVTWYGGMLLNRTAGISSSMAAGNRAAAIILACNKADPTDADARGYGLFMFSSSVTGESTNQRQIYLIYFSKGINGLGRSSANLTGRGTILARSQSIANGTGIYYYTKVTYNPRTNEWILGLRTGTSFGNPASSAEFTYQNAVVNNEGTGAAMPNFGFAASYTSSDSYVRFDNFYVSVGEEQEGTLPVKLTSFTAQKSLNGEQLNWQTASEQNNSHFEVLRSADGVNFSAIGSVAGKGTAAETTNYSFTDTNPLQGTAYYQLKQVDFSGNSALSNIIAVNNSLSGKNLQVYVSESGNVVISYISAGESSATVEILNIAGKKVVEQTVNLQKGESRIEIPVNLANGVYVAQLSSGGTQTSVKFLK